MDGLKRGTYGATITVNGTRGNMNRHIRRKFRVKGFENLPYTGWLKSTREHLAELYSELGYTVGAEIGVRRGRFSQLILSKNPSLKMHCIDPWTPFGRHSQERQDRYFENAQARLKEYDVTFIKKTSMDALEDFDDESLDFVYVDGLHDFDNVMSDIIGWNRKVRSGGIVSGHDYIHLHGCGVIPAVNAFVEGHNIREWYITQEYTPAPSFFWVKP